jgi:hypothetical protein
MNILQRRPPRLDGTRLARVKLRIWLVVFLGWCRFRLAILAVMVTLRLLITRLGHKPLAAGLRARAGVSVLRARVDQVRAAARDLLSLHTGVCRG